MIPNAAWSVSVTTAPRAVDLLPQTLASVFSAGWPFGVKVFADGHRPRVPKRALVRWGYGSDQWSIVWCELNCPPDETIGPWRNFWISLKVSITQEPWADWLLVIQDDCKLSQSLREYLERSPHFDLFRSNRNGILSLYTPAGCEQLLKTNFTGSPLFFYPSPGLGSMYPGGLAYVLHRDTARALVDVAQRFEGRAENDRKVAAWCQSTNRPLLGHHPSLAYHLGVGQSTLRPAEGDHRQCGVFCENAATLLNKPSMRF